jgi:hypothetical protein
MSYDIYTELFAIFLINYTFMEFIKFHYFD